MTTIRVLWGWVVVIINKLFVCLEEEHAVAMASIAQHVPQHELERLA